jgi:hypothetical protein
MTYRDNLEAARMRHEDLVRELIEVRQRLADRAELAARERALLAAVAESSAQVDHLRSRASLPLLQKLQIASPCHEKWDAMRGDDRARHCGKCDKVVYDLSAISAAEAEALLASRGELCVRFYRRADGTVMTSDCPEGARRRRRRRLVVAVAVAGLSAAAGAVSFHFMTRDVGPMGKMVPASQEPIDTTTGVLVATPQPPPAPPVVYQGPPPLPEHDMGKPPSRR